MYTSQSQLIEKYVDQLFPAPGFFLEIGCWDGEHLSQTAYLERERGWTGLCVDPFPLNFEDRSSDLCAKAISRDGQPRPFLKVTTDRRYGGVVSYFSGFKASVMHNVNWPLIEQFCEYEEIVVETITFDQLCEQYAIPSHVDFLSVDVEGSELEIFESINFDEHTFGLVAFEHNLDQDARARIGEILEGHGYKLFEAWEYDDIYVFSHKGWLANEYRKWIEALKVSTVHNFKDHPMVKRMLGDFEWAGPMVEGLSSDAFDLLARIDQIGESADRYYPRLSGPCLRMVYYARKVLDQNPKSIVEIGGGVGQFYAVLRALGYTGRYYIFDLPEVKEFQSAYLSEVEKQAGLSLPYFQYPRSYDFCVSFYALGEFDDETKAWYIENVVKKCRHGFIVWNPHSGASDMISFDCTVADEDPLLHPGNKQLTW